jgi:hypothetical protein
MGLFVDGIVQAGQISGEQPWTDAEVSIPAGLHTVRWQAFRQGALPGGGGVGAWLDAVRLEGGGFDSWAALAGLKGADALPLADPDRDGRPNLLEYAFNLDPRSAVILPGGGATGRPPVGKIAGTGSNARLVLEYLRRKSGGITYTPVFGDDLRSWTTAVGSLTTSDLGGDWELVTVVDSVSLGSQGQRFGAVQVSLP